MGIIIINEEDLGSSESTAKGRRVMMVLKSQSLNCTVELGKENYKRIFRG